MHGIMKSQGEPPESIKSYGDKMSTWATTPGDLDFTGITAAGNEYQVVIYVDPFPGRKGSERIQETCGKCGGEGVIHYGNVTLQVGKRSGRICFQCMGAGVTSRLVSSARRTAKAQANAATARNMAAADYVNTELEDAHTEALAEEARRAALVTGFLGEVGDRLRNITARVDVNSKFEAPSYGGYSVDYKSMLILTDETTGKVLKVVTGRRDFERGETVTVTGTVKSHSNYSGQDQTILQRAKVERVSK